MCLTHIRWRQLGDIATHYNSDVFLIQFPIAKRFVYHLVFYRELSAAYTAHGLQSEFWTTTIDAHLLQAAILWCNVFGSHGSSAIHWKHLSHQDSDKLQVSFRKGLEKNVGLSRSQWGKYWKEMTYFRNKYAAHRDHYEKPVPQFDIALNVAYFYDSWVRQVISPHSFAEPTLIATAERLKRDFAPLIERLFKTTEDV